MCDVIEGRLGFSVIAMRCVAMIYGRTFQKKNEEQGENGNKVRSLSKAVCERWDINLLRLLGGREC
jgi:hypothetical protein